MCTLNNDDSTHTLLLLGCLLLRASVDDDPRPRGLRLIALCERANVLEREGERAAAVFIRECVDLSPLSPFSSDDIAFLPSHIYIYVALSPPQQQKDRRREASAARPTIIHNASSRPKPNSLLLVAGRLRRRAERAQYLAHSPLSLME